MGVKSQEVKEHVVLQAAGEIFPPTWNKHRVFHQEQGAIESASLHTSLALADLPAELIKHFTEAQQQRLPRNQTQPTPPS